jgi:hypothetical protein
VKIDIKNENSLWQLGILALLYEATSEKKAETNFERIRNKELLVNPKEIWNLAKDCKCPFLLESNRVTFCDYSKNDGKCPEPYYSKSFQDCPVPRVTHLINRMATISKSIVSFAILLKEFNFNFDDLYNIVQKMPKNKRTQKILDLFTMVLGEKTAHLFLGWVSNPIYNGVFGIDKPWWNLNYNTFLAINSHITQVADRIELCRSKNTSVIRANLRELQEKTGLQNSKVLELALLNVGQKYCTKDKKKQKCDSCHFKVRAPKTMIS